MADGNMGSLWVSLGLKETVTKELTRLQKSLTGTDKKTQELKDNLKDINKSLNSGQMETAVGGLSQLRQALAKTGDDAKGLKAILNGMGNVFDFSKLFNKRINATNAKDFLALVNSIKSALGEIGSTRSEKTDALFTSLNKSSQYIADVMSLKNNIKGLKDTLETPVGKNHEDAINGLIAEYQALRQAMLGALNSGAWDKTAGYNLSKQHNELLVKQIQLQQELNAASTGTSASSAAASKVEEAQIKAATEAVEKQATAEKKAAEAIEQKAAAQQKANEALSKQPAKNGPAVENKDFNAAVDSMVGKNNVLTEEQKKAFREIKAEAEKAAKSVNKMLNTLLGGKDVAGMSTHEIAKASASYSKELANLDAQLRKKSHFKSEGLDSDPTKDIRNQIKNAQIFLELIQRIDLKQEKIAQKKATQPNINTKELERANSLLEKFGTTLMDIVRKGNADGSQVLSNFPKAFQATAREVDSIMGKFSKENSLSVFANNADKANVAISNLETKIKDLQRLNEEGRQNNYKTGMLPENITFMQLKLKELNRLFDDNWQKMTDKSYMSNLFSDIAKTMTLARNAEHEYGKEKARTIAMTRAQEKANKNRTDELEKAEKRYVSLGKAIEKARTQASRAVVLNIDSSQLTRKIDEAKQKMRVLESYMYGLRNKDWSLVGTLDNKANGTYVSSINNETRALKEKLEVQQRLNDAKEKSSRTAIKENFRAQTEMDARGRKQKLDTIKQAYIDFFNGVDVNAKQTSERVARSAAEMNRALREATRISPDNTIKDIERQIIAAEKEMEKLGRTILSITEKGDPSKNGMMPAFKEYTEAYRAYGQYTQLLYKQMEAQERASQSVKSYADSLIRVAPTEAQHAQRQRELTNTFEAYFRTQEKAVRAQELAEAAEKRNAEAIARTNQVRREAVSATRAQAVASVKARIQALEEQKKLLSSAYKNAKGVLAAEEVERIKTAYSAVTQELMQLRTVVQDLSHYNVLSNQFGIGGLMASARGTTSFSPLIASANRDVERTTRGINEAKKSALDLAKAFEQAKEKASGMNSVIQDLKSLFLQGGVVYGAQQFVMSVIQTGGELEKQHIAMQAILGDVQNANNMFAQIKELALNSPFTFSELNKDVKQLAAYGVEYDQLYDTTKRLADISSGLGVSFERIALAFGQVQARGWLDGKELRQIAYAGIPLLDKLSEYYSKREGKKVTTSEIKTRISGRGVSFEDVKNIFWEMTNAGGEFYNMQQVLSDTLLGKYNKLKDAWEIMLSDFAAGNNVVGKGLKGILELVTQLVQALHTAAPVVASAFTGVAMRGIQKALGSSGNALLAGKANMASNIQQKVFLGEDVTDRELRILQNKTRITTEDLKQLAAVKAISKAELDRMLITGQISAAQYKQTIAMMGMEVRAGNIAQRFRSLWATIRGIPTQIQNAARSSVVWLRNIDINWKAVKLQFALGWRSFSLHAKAAMSTAIVGIRTLGSGMLAMMGGVPGLIMTGLAMGYSYIASKNAELKNNIEQTASEIEDRLKQLNDFLRENDTSKVIAGGDTKEIDNLIDAYKEKLKQLAPYNYNNLLLTAEEKKSHEERLKYLDEELKRLKDAETIAKAKLSSQSTYKDLSAAIGGANERYARFDRRTADFMQDGMGRADARRKAWQTMQPYERDSLTKSVAEKIREAFGDIGKDETMRMAAMQAMSNIFVSMQIPEDRQNMIRASVLQSFGIGDKDAWLQDIVKSKMRSMIDKTIPDIARKIENGQALNEAEKKKVKELMAGARKDTAREYPEYESSLQRLLAESNFEAVIHLVFDEDDLSELQRQVSNNIWTGTTPFLPDSKEWQKRASEEKALSPYLKDAGESYYKARNNVKTALDERYNELLTRQGLKKKGKLSEEKVKEAEDAYQTLWDAAFRGLGYSYVPEAKKSNKTKNSHETKRDEELERLKQRLDDFKAARQMYQRLVKDVHKSKGEAKDFVKELFPDLNWKDIDLSKYEESISKLKKGFNFDKTPERKKLRTQIDRESAEWKISEELKPEYDRIAANFTEALNRGANQADLYKSLFEKTGNKNFAALALKNGAVWNEYTKQLAAQFEKEVGFAPDVDMTDADAKRLLVDDKGNQEMYEQWKKITELVHQAYTNSLNEAGEILKNNLDYSKQAVLIQEEYNKALERAKLLEQTDPEGAAALRTQAEQERNRKTTDLRYKQTTNSVDYARFFATTIQQSTADLEGYARKLKMLLADALETGAIKADVYAKKIEEINKRMSNIQKFRFLGGGLDGVVEKRRELGQKKVEEGQSLYNNGLAELQQAELSGDKDKIAAAKQAMETGKKMMDGGAELMDGADSMEHSISIAGAIIHGINDNVQSMYATFQDIKETASSFGVDTDTDSWTDTEAYFKGAAESSQGISNAFDSAKSGNAMGVVQGVVQSFTGWFKAFNAAHDEKLERQIQIADRQLRLMESIRSIIDKNLSDTLGGVYNYKMSDYTKDKLTGVKNDYEKRKALEAELESLKGNKAVKGALIGALAGPVGSLVGGLFGLFTDPKRKLRHKIRKIPKYSEETYEQVQKALDTASAYEAQKASLMVERDQLQQKLNRENKKKKKDKDKIADYEKEIAEKEMELESFAQDYLKSIYSVDLKSWASQLTDAVVSAWSKGEDAMDAYKDKAKDLIKDLTKNVISQKIMETAMGPILEDMKKELEATNGKLGTSSIIKFASELSEAGKNATESIVALLEEMKNQGWDLSETGDGSLTNGIKNITEETADILASYVNAIRLDVSVNRAQVKGIADLLQTEIPVMGQIQQAQLNRLTQIVVLAEARNEKLDVMYDWMVSVSTSGRKKIYIS